MLPCAGSPALGMFGGAALPAGRAAVGFGVRNRQGGNLPASFAAGAADGAPGGNVFIAGAGRALIGGAGARAICGAGRSAGGGAAIAFSSGCGDVEKTCVTRRQSDRLLGVPVAGWLRGKRGRGLSTVS